MRIKYTGPFLSVTAGDYTFVRGVEQEVHDEELANRLITAKYHDGKPLFEAVDGVAVPALT